MEYTNDLVDEMAIRALEEDMYMDESSDIIEVKFANGVVREYDPEIGFDSLVVRMVKYNAKAIGPRCLSVKQGKFSMCAPMENNKPKNCGIKGRGRLDDIYLVPEKG